MTDTLPAYMLDARTGQTHEVESDIPAPTEAVRLESERQGMQCTAVQLRLALHRAGRLAEAQAIIEKDPEASIIWDHDTKFRRASRLLTTLAEGSFSGADLDTIFRAAMAIEAEGVAAEPRSE